MRADLFEYGFPVFVLLGRVERGARNRAALTYHDLVTLRGAPNPDALAVFTDKAAAEQFRDEYASDKTVLEVPATEDFLNVLAAAHQLGVAVVFDPFRMGVPAHTASVDEVLRGLGTRNET